MEIKKIIFKQILKHRISNTWPNKGHKNFRKPNGYKCIFHKLSSESIISFL